jgi:hypothetical protein
MSAMSEELHYLVDLLPEAELGPVRTWPDTRERFLPRNSAGEGAAAPL